MRGCLISSMLCFAAMLRPGTSNIFTKKWCSARAVLKRIKSRCLLKVKRLIRRDAFSATRAMICSRMRFTEYHWTNSTFGVPFLSDRLKRQRMASVMFHSHWTRKRSYSKTKTSAQSGPALTKININLSWWRLSLRKSRLPLSRFVRGSSRLVASQWRKRMNFRKRTIENVFASTN